MKIKNLVSALVLGGMTALQATPQQEAMVSNIVRMQDIPMMMPIYEKFQAEAWFQAMPEYPVYQVLGYFLPKNNQPTELISQTQAYNYLNYIYSDATEQAIKDANDYTETNNLKILNKVINDNMFAIGT